MRKSFRQILLAALVLTFICGAASANTNVSITIDITGENGRGVLWEDGVIEAGGMGVVPKNASTRAQGRALARRAAIMDAQRNLLEATKGVNITANSAMGDFMAQDSVVTSVNGVIRGARVVVEEDRTAEEGGKGSYIVVMQMNLSSLSPIALNAVRPAQAKIEPFPQPATGYRPAVVQGYTGLVINAKNKGLLGAFSPCIYDDTGRKIYGDQFIDPDFAISQGMVDYSSLNIAVSGNSRAGTNPLIIDAIGVRGHNFDVIISYADAEKVLAAQAQSGFMKRCAVVFARN